MAQRAKPKSRSRSKPKRSAASADSGTKAEQSVQAFRDALEKSVTISRERLQEVVDDAVMRGRMTRGDAEDLVTRLVTRGREQAEDIAAQLEAALTQLREAGEAATEQPRRTARSAGRAAGRAKREIEDATERAREEVESRARSARARAVGAVSEPLARADRVRRRTVSGFPIGAYDDLSVRQIDGRLTDLTREELRKVRRYEERNKGRKGVLRAVDRKLNRKR